MPEKVARVQVNKVARVQVKTREEVKKQPGYGEGTH
jgi:hypothetical protein